MNKQLQYHYHEPLDGWGDDGIKHRVVVPAHSRFNSTDWDRELLIGSDVEAGELAKMIVVAVNEHLIALEHSEYLSRNVVEERK